MRIALFGITCCCILALTARSKADPFADAWRKGDEAYHRKDYKAAIDWYNVAVERAASERAETVASIYSQRGLAYNRLGDTDRAIADYTRAVDLRGEAVDYSVRAFAYLNKEDYDYAIADYTRAIKMKGDADAWDYSGRAHAYMYKKDYERSITDFTKAIALEPDDAGYYAGRADAYNENKDYAKALPDYEKAVKLQPSNPSRFNELAWMLATCPDKDCRNGEKAWGYARNALKMDPKNPYYMGTLAAAYAECGDYEGAVEWAQKAISAHKPADKDALETARSELQQFLKGEPYRDR